MGKAAYCILLASLIVLTLVTGCGLIGCGECGKYVSQSKPSDFLELKADGTFYMGDKAIGVTGTWKINGNTVTLTFDALPIATQATLEGDTLTDPDGIEWVKQ